MSFREKTAWVTLCAIVLVSAGCWFYVHAPFHPQSPIRLIHAMSLSFGLYLLIELAAWLVLRWRYPRDAREPKDEREKLIDLKALRVAYYALAAGALAAVFVTLHVVGAGPGTLGTAVFVAFLLSQVVKHAARIVCYRRGF